MDVDKFVKTLRGVVRDFTPLVAALLIPGASHNHTDTVQVVVKREIVYVPAPQANTAKPAPE